MLTIIDIFLTGVVRLINILLRIVVETPLLEITGRMEIKIMLMQTFTTRDHYPEYLATVIGSQYNTPALSVGELISN